MTVTEFPRPAIDAAPTEQVRRWVPSRAGILNVWRYYDEVFEFHRGRLLLRGPNGTGKSKALELLLPFLFDANLRANRLSTFGTGERTMHWNLMGEGASGVTRVGYVWMEFRLPGAPDRWFCCGARLQASAHTTTVHTDYFTTSQRIGVADGLSLVTDTGQPLTRSTLEQRLGEHGVLHQSASDYRAAVRAALFPGLTEQRYDALITALLQLRTPKLSQRLDPSLLSTLLSHALPPLGQQEIAELAEGFERLDRQRERLSELDAEVAAAGVLGTRQRTYARRVLRAAAARLISATTDLNNLSEAARTSAEEYERVAEQKKVAEASVDTLDGELAATQARIDGLTDSEAYGQGRELDNRRQQAAEAKQRATAIRGDAGHKRGQATADRTRAEKAEGRARLQADAVRGWADDALRAATRAGLVSVHQQIAGRLDADASQPRLLLRAAVQARHTQLALVRQALDEHDHAVRRRVDAESELGDARDDLTAAQDRQAAATEAYEVELRQLSARVHDWATACRELRFANPAGLLELIGSQPALVAAVTSAAEAVLHEITRAETTIGAERDRVQADRDTMDAEWTRLAAEEDVPPTPPPTRTADRSRMTGAPLWRLVRFAHTTPESAQAPIEAALQAAGLLDAWVGASGSIEGHDIFADPDAVPAVSGRSLADILVPEPETEHAGAVSAEAVYRLLASIAYGERPPNGHPAAVGADGGWRLGNLSGSWAKDHAEHIGAMARARARERRLRELDLLIGELDLAIAGLDAQLDTLRRRRTVVASERTACPDHHAVDAAMVTLTRAESEVSAKDRVVRQRIDILSERERQVAGAFRALNSAAAEHGVPAERTALDNLAQAVDALHTQAETWLDGHAQLVATQQHAGALTEQADRSEHAAAEREREASTAEGRDRQLSTMVEAVESTIGVDYRKVLGEIDQLRTRKGELARTLEQTRKAVVELAERRGVLDTQRTTDAAKRDDAIEVRDAAAHRFRHLASGNLAADGELDDFVSFETILSASDGVRAALDAARLVAAAWPTVPHAPNNLGDALQRLADSVHECRAALSDRADLDLETDEDVQVFTAVVDGIRVGAAELKKILKSEADQSRQDITERERELFDQTLTGDTRRHLAARIRQAGELVDGMNTRLERVRTASNVSVRLVWQIASDLPTGTKAARDLLLKDPVRLTDADRESLHQFFRERIEQAKAEVDTGSWEQQLAHVFDYTRWHQFVVKIDRGNGVGWQLLTKKLHGALSGGEKAIALHLPLFAAVAAHYQAVPEAPRIILLDEVFVGVDTNNRGQVFELLSALDLDLMLTSDHEWCTYRELSGIAVHQLITGDDGDDAVTTARFVWDGHDLHADAGTRPPS